MKKKVGKFKYLDSIIHRERFQTKEIMRRELEKTEKQLLCSTETEMLFSRQSDKYTAQPYKALHDSQM